MIKKSQQHNVRRNRQRTRNGPAPFWHPLIHRKFSEELFYFLIAVKPYDHTKSFEGLQNAMAAFGISRYCAYQIFGQFDMLVRVWLPAGQSEVFINMVVEEIQNLHSIIEYHVSRTAEDWRFQERLSEEGEALLANITPRQVRDVQDGKDPKLAKDLEGAGIYKVVRDYLSENSKSIKAFISVSEPSNKAREKRGALFKELTEKLKGNSDLKQATVYSGIGFTWILIKIVADDYYEIGRIVDGLAKELKEEGIFTSTYLVASENYREGECISHRALAHKEGDDRVRLFLPELYSLSEPEDASFKRELEHFVIDKIVETRDLELSDKLALQGFLRCVILESPIDAFKELFPPFVKTEQELRELVIREAEKLPKKIDDLKAAIDPEKKFIKTIPTMSMAMVLKGCLYLAQKFRQPSGKTVDEISPGTIESLANVRNRIMHGSEFHPRSEWRKFAEALVNLADVRKKIRSQLAQYEKANENPSDVQVG